MRSIRSARTAASSGTAPFSFVISRSRNSSCISTTSLASGNSRLQKLIVSIAFSVELVREQ